MPRFSRSPLFRSCFGRTTAVEIPKLPSRRVAPVNSPRRHSLSSFGSATPPLSPQDLSLKLAGSHLHDFTLKELNAVTRGFSVSNFIGQGGFGPVYKGFVDGNLLPGLEAQMVAFKLLDLEGQQGHGEWLAELIFLGHLRHPNLVKLIGYCYENEHRLLVYEHMSKGSLENHLFKKVLAPLSWSTRLKIAVGAAKGLAFLHGAEEPVIYRDFKASNILLDMDYEPKLSDFGLAKEGPQGDDTHVTTRIMGTSGYTAPEYVMTGHLTTRSDVYSFGVVLLELLTGRRSLDRKRPNREQDLVEWAKPYLRSQQKLHRVMDPSLEGQYSTIGAQKAAELAYRCLSYRPKERPNMTLVVEMLEPLMGLRDIPMGSFVYTAMTEKLEYEAEKNTDINNESAGGANWTRHCNENRHKRR